MNTLSLTATQGTLRLWRVRARISARTIVTRIVFSASAYGAGRNALQKLADDGWPKASIVEVNEL